ncbi:hypothetical protein Tco_0411745 [Tanacetum coccineum]
MYPQQTCGGEKNSKGSSYDFSVIWSWVSILAVLLASICISFSSLQASQRSDMAYTVFIAFTPTIHALDQHVRVLLYYTNRLDIFFTFSEAARELFSAVSELKLHYNVTNAEELDEKLVNKPYEFHYPLNVIPVMYFVTSSAGILGVYLYAQGVQKDIPRHKMAEKIKLFKLLIELEFNFCMQPRVSASWQHLYGILPHFFARV